MNNYYSQKLSAERLQLVYQIDSPRIKQYLNEEIKFVLNKIRPGDTVLELGCGYGRVLEKLVARARLVVGIDMSVDSLTLAKEFSERYLLIAMNAVTTGFKDNKFDKVVCIQNGLSAFHVDQKKLIEETIRITRPGGLVLFSSYAQSFWQHRLDWFRLQANYGLVGEIDEQATGNGIIVCKDGFKATTITPGKFIALTAGLHIHPIITEVDGSSVFFEIPVL